MINVLLFRKDHEPVGVELPQVPAHGDIIALSSTDAYKVDRVVYAAQQAGDNFWTTTDIHVFAKKIAL